MDKGSSYLGQCCSGPTSITLTLKAVFPCSCTRAKQKEMRSTDKLCSDSFTSIARVLARGHDPCAGASLLRPYQDPALHTLPGPPAPLLESTCPTCTVLGGDLSWELILYGYRMARPAKQAACFLNLEYHKTTTEMSRAADCCCLGREHRAAWAALGVCVQGQALPGSWVTLCKREEGSTALRGMVPRHQRPPRSGTEQ